jgi:hypothetical protein
VADLAKHVAAATPTPVFLAVDATGVGKPVVEMIDRPDLAVELIQVLITCGHAFTRPAYDLWHLAKVQLVGTVQAALSSGRLKVAAELPLAATLVQEMKDFKARVTPAGHEVFEGRVGRHDDLLLAVAVAMFVAEHVPRGRVQIYT